MTLGGVSVVLGLPGEGIVAWLLDGVEGSVAGLAQLALAPARSFQTHPNGALGIDHLVLTTPDFDRTATALARAGMPLRRVREAPSGIRQGFRRLGPAILELVETTGPPGPARFWGLAIVVQDLDALASLLGAHLAAPRPAVQARRRIATLRASAGLGQAVAFMDPEA